MDVSPPSQEERDPLMKWNVDPIPDWQVWDLKNAAANFMLPRLQMFREWAKEGRFIALPTWVSADPENCQESDEELSDRWVNILEEMILAFQLITAPSDFNHIPPLTQKGLKERGLQLFAKYFEHLWD